MTPGRPLLVVVLTVVVPVVFVGLAPLLIAIATPSAWEVGMGPARILAFAPWLAGAACALWAAAAFTVSGRGTPTSADPPKTLVAHGLFRSVRNPMYVGALLIVAGTALWTGSLLVLAYWAIMWAALHAFVVRYEEPRLLRRFGDSYARYLERVPRWLPRLPDRG